MFLFCGGGTGEQYKSMVILMDFPEQKNRALFEFVA